MPRSGRRQFLKMLGLSPALAVVGRQPATEPASPHIEVLPAVREAAARAGIDEDRAIQEARSVLGAIRINQSIRVSPEVDMERLAEKVVQQTTDAIIDVLDAEEHKVEAQGRQAARAWQARGGTVWPGRPYLVGESGPEIFRFNRSGKVIPHGLA